VARALTQAAGVFNSALWPEFSRALGEGDIEFARQLHRLAFSVSLWGILPASVALFLVRDSIFHAWSHGAVAISTGLFGLTLLQTGFNILWGTSSVVAAAVNRHQRNSLTYVVMVGVGVTLSIPVIQRFGLVGATASIAIPDAIMLPVALMSALSIVDDKWSSFAAAIARPPIRDVLAVVAKMRA
jgi:O-antigen/teichoic acid export membrane protein